MPSVPQINMVWRIVFVIGYSLEAHPTKWAQTIRDDDDADNEEGLFL